LTARTALAAAILAAALPRGAPCQRLTDARALPGATTSTAPEILAPRGSDALVAAATPRRWWAPLASAAVPGTGQLALRQERFIAYAATEAIVFVAYAASRAEGRRESRRYRTLAADVAQAPFSSPTREGDFAYYERMRHFAESGAYDLIPGGGVDPEVDTLTSNGAVWLLARRTYWTDADEPPPPDAPAYADALRFYEQRAVPTELRWSWRNAQLEYDLYRRSMDRSNDGYRRASSALAVILANHLLSGIDAFVTLRLQATRGAAGSRYDLGATMPWGRRTVRGGP
jgi:hypothetical protein